VAAKAVHVTQGLGQAALGHDNGDLMQRLGQQRPEVPIVLGRTEPERGSRLMA
jgi:hypothetical protein